MTETNGENRRFRLSAAEREDLLDRASVFLTIRPRSSKELRKLVKYPGSNSGRFTAMLKARFSTNAQGLFTSNPANVRVERRLQTENHSQTSKKMARTIDRMAKHIEDLEAEVARLTKRLQEAGSMPVLTERAKKALAVYGE